MANGINPIGSLQGKVDSNNQLVVALGAGSVLPSDADVGAGTGTAEAGLGGVLTISTTTAQTGANTTETDLWTYSLPANTLSVNGQTLRIRAFVSFAANGNTKTTTFYFGGSTIVSGSGNNRTIEIIVVVTRLSATTQVMSGSITSHNVGSLATTQSIGTVATPAETLSDAVTIKVTGTNGTANAGDIVFRTAMVEFLRAGS